MLELGDAELELVELVPRHEVELVHERTERRHGPLRQPLASAPEPRGQLGQQLLDGVEERPAATARGHAASSAAAAAAAPAAPGPRAPTARRSPRRPGPASAPRRAPPRRPRAPRFP